MAGTQALLLASFGLFVIALLEALLMHCSHSNHNTVFAGARYLMVASKLDLDKIVEMDEQLCSQIKAIYIIIYIYIYI